MEKSDKIYIAGHTGLVGSAITRMLIKKGYENLLLKTHRELPLEDGLAVYNFFDKNKPDYVFLCAAKVGGIVANATCGADFIRDNLLIQTNVIDAACRYKTKKLLFLGSSCIYPKFSKQPIQESELLTGSLEPTNLPYAVAKISGKVMCDAYKAQHGFNAFTVMPCNVYGVGDNFHPINSHLVAGMMRRFHEAKIHGATQVEVWGTGNPQRELINSDDLAEACILLMQYYDDGGMINAGSSQEISVRDLAQTIAEVVNYTGKIVFDTNRPDGTLRKIMDNSRLRELGWVPKVSLIDGLTTMYATWLEEGQCPS